MNVSVLGGGIAGISTAIALRLEGINVKVYERHPEPSDIGAGIVCWPNACFVLDKFGILDMVKRVSGSPHAMNRFSNNGERLGSLNIDRLSQLMEYPTYSIVRSDLMKILTNRLHDLGGEIHYSHQVNRLIDNPNGKVSVHFENGHCIHPDIVIGADGRMNSVARQYVNADNKPVYQGFINWVGIVENDLGWFSDMAVSDYWGVGERFGIVPISPTKAYWAGGQAAAEIGDRQSALYKKELHELFHDWPLLINDIIKATPMQSINKIYVHDHDPISCWHKNNVLLLGDAAHSPLPTSGQGACQALEDAWHLARVLLNNDRLVTAFTQFTNRRYEKTTSIIMSGRQLARSIFNSDSDFCDQRNESSKQTDYSTVIAGMAQGWSSGLPMASKTSVDVVSQ